MLAENNFSQADAQSLAHRGGMFRPQSQADAQSLAHHGGMVRPRSEKRMHRSIENMSASIEE